MLYDGQALNDTDFSREMEGSLGTFAMTNQYSVENIEKQLKQRDKLVRQMQIQMKATEQEVRKQMNKDFE
jgi:hypothetical protein